MSGTLRRAAVRVAVAGGVIWIALAGVMPASAQQVATEGARVAVIDVRRILTESEAGRTSLEALRGLAEQRRGEIAALEESVDQAKTRLEEGRQSFSDDRIKQMEQELQGMMIEMRRAEDDARRELEDRQIAEFGAIEERVMPLIQSLGEEMGYELIFNKFEDSGLLFAAPGADITNLVLERFDALPEE